MKQLEKHRPTFNRVWEEIFGDNHPVRFAAEVTDIGTEDDATVFLLKASAALPG